MSVSVCTYGCVRVCGEGGAADNALVVHHVRVVCRSDVAAVTVSLFSF